MGVVILCYLRKCGMSSRKRVMRLVDGMFTWKLRLVFEFGIYHPINILLLQLVPSIYANIISYAITTGLGYCVTSQLDCVCEWLT